MSELEERFYLISGRIRLYIDCLSRHLNPDVFSTLQFHASETNNYSLLLGYVISGV